MCQWICVFTTVEASNLGTFLTGIAAILAIVIAPHEFREWRDKEQLRRQSELATKASVRCLRLLTALENIFSPAVWNHEKEPDQSKEGAGQGKGRAEIVHRRIQTRIAAASQDFNDFLATWTELEAVMPELAVNTCARCWDLWADMKSNFDTYVMLFGQGNEPGIYTEYYDRSVGRTIGDDIKKLRSEVAEAFRPSINMK